MMSNKTQTIGWADVPADLIILLIERLSGVVSFIRFSAACSYWNSLCMANPNFSNKQLPWLMLAETETDDRQFYDVSTQELYHLPLPQVTGRKAAGSAHGWLVTLGLDSELHLCNPLTGSQIRLPPQRTFEISELDEESRSSLFPPKLMRRCFILKASLLPNPTTGDYTVMAVYYGHGCSFSLAYCKSGDNAWTRIGEGSTGRGEREIAFVKGRFFSVDYDGLISSVEISPKPKLEKIVGFYFPPHEKWMHYLVECNDRDELLVVMRKLKNCSCSELPRSMITRRFDVYKLDLETKMASEIKNIGDYALFVGYNNSLCVPTKGTTLRRNCIYFTDDGYDFCFGSDDVERGREMGVFSLDDGMIESHYPGVSVSSFSPPIWFTPNISFN